MKRIASLLVALLVVCPAAYASDGFEKVRCGADIPKALIGQHLSNEPVAAIESRYAALGLKNLGSYDASDTLFSASWLICGSEFELIVDEHSLVHDALQFPAHSKSSPGFIGSCRLKGKDIPGTVIAVLDNEAGKETLAAKAAWKIDDKAARFVKLDSEGLRCPRDGILTQDGGK